MLSGTLDPDKLDYLNRDAYYCGIPYGLQDVSYIIRNLIYTKERELAMPIEAISSVEQLLFSKYSMYRNVYWHKTTRSATAMIKKAVLLALDDALFTEDELYNLDDESFKFLFDRNAGSSSEKLFTKVRSNQLLTLKATFDLEAVKFITHQDKKEIELIILDDLKAKYKQIDFSDVVLDIPENISFEADIPILDSDGSLKNFNEVSKLFTKEVVSTFASSLQFGRLFLNTDIDSSYAQQLLDEVISRYANN